MYRVAQNKAECFIFRSTCFLMEIQFHYVLYLWTRNASCTLNFFSIFEGARLILLATDYFANIFGRSYSAPLFMCHPAHATKMSNFICSF